MDPETVSAEDLAAQLSAAIASDFDQFLTSSDIVMVEDDDEERGNDNAMQDVVAPPYNLNDVLDVINRQSDETGQEQNTSDTMSSSHVDRSGSHASSSSGSRSRSRAFVEILEQPAPKALRFRYECEGRSAGSIPGINSTTENKTFPSIRLCGHKGDAFVVVSCVTKDAPHKPHPHNLVGKDCKTGVCTVKITEGNQDVTFNNLGIQCIRKKDIEEALKKREEIKVDPFKTGFSHRNQPSSIDLNAIRLCFQVFVSSPNGLVAIQPVISEPIYDKKAMSELVITKLSHCSAPVSGGKEVILLCEKVAKEDIAVRFYEEQDGQVVWEANGDFQHNNVHKQVAISFKVPAYRNVQVDHTVRVYVQLRRPSDGATSDALPFDYLPLETGRRSFLSMRKALFRKYSLTHRSHENAQPHIEGVVAQQQPLKIEETPEEQREDDSFSRFLRDERTMMFTGHPPPPEVTVTDEHNQLNNSHLEDETVIILDTPTTENKDILENRTITEVSVAEAAPGPVDPVEKTNEWLENTEYTPTLDDGFALDTNEILNDIEIIGQPYQHQDSLEEYQHDRNNNSVMRSPCGADEDKTLSELLNQVAELDEIYTDHQIRRNLLIEKELASLDNSLPKARNMEEDQMDVDELFDDAATYSSLQKAFKNPVDLMPPVYTPPGNNTYDAVEPLSVLHNPLGPMIDVSPLKRENLEEEKLPPLPPKRKKPPTVEDSPSSNKENKAGGEIVEGRLVLSDSESIGLGSNFTNSRRSSTKSLANRPPSQIIIMKTPEPGAPIKSLPPTPNLSGSKSSSTSKLNSTKASTTSLPKQKKPGFFSKLFNRRKSKSDLADSKSMDHLNRNGTTSPASPERSSDEEFLGPPMSATRFSNRSLKVPTPIHHRAGRPVGRSVSSVSGKRPNMTPDIVHIPLKGDSTNSLPMHDDGPSPFRSYHTSPRNISSYSIADDRKTMSALQLADLPLQEGNMELIAIADAQSLKNLCEGQYGVQLDPSVDLTEAEHYALYTSVAPRATTSEFDETSAYYAPVEAGEILTAAEVASRLKNNF